MSLPTNYRKVVAILTMLDLVLVSYIASFFLRFGPNLSVIPWETVYQTLPLLIIVRAASLWWAGLYHGLWRYVGVLDLVQIIKAVTISSILFTILLIITSEINEFPITVLMIDWAGTIFLLGGVRLVTRLVREKYFPSIGSRNNSKRLLVIGAGDAGAALCAQILRDSAHQFNPVAFVDDDSGKIGMSIQGVKVAGPTVDIPNVVTDYNVDSAVISIPSAKAKNLRRIVEICLQAKVPFKVLPQTSEILEGTVRLSRIRDVDPVDLLGRPPANLNQDTISHFINGKRVLVTGAAGSVGSELAHQLANLKPELLLLVDNAESPLFFLESEMRTNFPNTPLVAEVLDVSSNVNGPTRLLSNYQPDVIYHAAAYKHVPMMEFASAEAIRNNIGGTYFLAEAAANAGTSTFVLVSTDKAVNPTNVMGATKRASELLLHSLNYHESTRSISVRFGNVVGSNASVVPIFKDQILHGGPITVTHPDATRYFMSLPEAAGLILQAGAIGESGDTFVLDMGDPLRIVDVAKSLITLSGLKYPDDIDIVFTGLRPGEKLSEELTYQNETLKTTPYEKLMVMKSATGKPDYPDNVRELLNNLPNLETKEVKTWLQQLVPEYQPSHLSNELDK